MDRPIDRSNIYWHIDTHVKDRLNDASMYWYITKRIPTHLYLYWSRYIDASSHQHIDKSLPMNPSIWWFNTWMHWCKDGLTDQYIDMYANTLVYDTHQRICLLTYQDIITIVDLRINLPVYWCCGMVGLYGIWEISILRNIFNIINSWDFQTSR